MKEIKQENKDKFWKCIEENLDENKRISTIKFNVVPDHSTEMFEAYLEELKKENSIFDYEVVYGFWYKIIML